MDYVYVGRIITTHGIKGELKIRSSFEYKNKVFVVGQKLFIGENKECHEILSYRKHQEYDMVVLSDILDIDKAIGYKKELVYALKSDISLKNNEYLDSDLYGFTCFFNNEKIGIVKKITFEGRENFVIRLDSGIIIPKNNHFIESIDFDAKKIIFKNLEGFY